MILPEKFLILFGENFILMYNYYSYPASSRQTYIYYCLQRVKKILQKTIKEIEPCEFLRVYPIETFQKKKRT